MMITLHPCEAGSLFLLLRSVSVHQLAEVESGVRVEEGRVSDAAGRKRALRTRIVCVDDAHRRV